MEFGSVPMGILIAAATILASSYQGYRSFHADPKKSRNKALTILCLAVVVLGSILSATRQAVVSNKLDEIKKQYNAHVGIAHWIVVPQYSHIAEGRTLWVALNLEATNNTASDVRIYTFGYILDGLPSNEQSDLAWSKAWNDYKKDDHSRDAGSDVTPENKLRFQTIKIGPLTSDDAYSLKIGSKFLYLSQ